MSLPPSPRPAPASRVVVSSTKRRDLLIATGIGLVVLGLIGLGIFGLSKVPAASNTNQLTGTIVAKHSRGEREQEISFGSKGLHERETDSGYQLDVKTEPDGRVYEIPDVPKVQYERYKVGDKYKFIKPRSEQQ